MKGEASELYGGLERSKGYETVTSFPTSAIPVTVKRLYLRLSAISTPQVAKRGPKTEVQMHSISRRMNGGAIPIGAWLSSPFS
jgi:hypothetical protein